MSCWVGPASNTMLERKTLFCNSMQILSSIEKLWLTELLSAALRERRWRNARCISAADSVPLVLLLKLLTWNFFSGSTESATSVDLELCFISTAILLSSDCNKNTSQHFLHSLAKVLGFDLTF